MSKSKSKCCGAELNNIASFLHPICAICGKPCEAVTDRKPAGKPPVSDIGQQPSARSDEEWINNEAPAFSTKDWATGTDRLCIVLDAMQHALAEGRRRERETNFYTAGPYLNAKEVAEREEAAAREAWANGWHYGFVSRDLPVGAEQMKFETWWKRRAGK